MYKVIRTFGDCKEGEVIDVTSWTAEEIADKVCDGTIEMVSESAPQVVAEPAPESPAPVVDQVAPEGEVAPVPTEETPVNSTE